MKRYLPAVLAGVAWLWSGAVCIWSAVVWEEKFDYASDVHLRKAWTLLNGSQISLGKDAAENEFAPHLKIGNSLIAHRLDSPLKGNWTLTWSVLHTEIKRGTWVGVFSADLRQGYAVLWDSSTVLQGMGNITLRQFHLEAPLASWNENGVVVGRGMNSGHSITAPPLAVFALTYDRMARTLSLSVDGVQKLSADDVVLDGVEMVLIKGNGLEYYDNLILKQE